VEYRGCRIAFAAGLTCAWSLIVTAAAVEAQEGGAPARRLRTAANSARPTLTAVRASMPPAIDGRLDDEIWQTAAVINTFVQQEPFEGLPASEQTEVRVAYDSEKVYFGIYAHYADVSLRRANRSDRDKLDNDDTVTVYLEPFLDYLRGYAFSVNGFGVQSDSMVVVQNAQSTAGGNLSFNALYYSGGQLVDDGWTAEIAVPIKSLRYPGRSNGEAHRWGFQVRRTIKSRDESAFWAPVSRSDPNFLAQIGLLTGMTNFSTQRNFELLPTFTAVRTGTLNAATGDFSTADVEEGGIDVKYGINSNLTFDFTYNPDFSQIESDNQQIEVNRRFPLNFPELRPFFLEGREIYELAGRPQPVQTRRIVDPRFAAKLTGKMSERTSLGLFFADDEAPGKVDNLNDPAYGRRAQNVLGRVKYELYRNAHVGMIFTDREFLEDHSRLIGFDTALPIGQTKNFGLRFYRTDREEGGIRRTGWSTENSIRHNGRNLDWSFIHNAISPDFGNQLSFVERVDQIQSMPSVSYRWYPESWIRNWGPTFSNPRLWDFDGVLQNEDYNPRIAMTFARNITLNVGYTRAMERFRDIPFDKNTWSISTNVNTSRKFLVSASVDSGDEIRFVSEPYLGNTREYSATITARPFSRLQSALRLTTSRFLDQRSGSDLTVFDVKILRSTTTYQFTPRLLIRNIWELNEGVGSRHTMFENILMTYRVNSGTVFYLGYDDRFRHGDAVNETIFPDASYERTNRAVFTKLSYLFRSGASQ
jgi:hypothetical protein